MKWTEEVVRAAAMAAATTAAGETAEMASQLGCLVAVEWRVAAGAAGRTRRLARTQAPATELSPGHAQHLATA